LKIRDKNERAAKNRRHNGASKTKAAVAQP